MRSFSNLSAVNTSKSWSRLLLSDPTKAWRHLRHPIDRVTLNEKENWSFSKSTLRKTAKQTAFLIFWEQLAIAFHSIFLVKTTQKFVASQRLTGHVSSGFYRISEIQNRSNHLLSQTSFLVCRAASRLVMTLKYGNQSYKDMSELVSKA